MKKLLTALALCGFTGMNLTAENVNSRTLTIGSTTVTVYRDSTPNTEPDKPTSDNTVFAIHNNGKIILVNAGLGGENGFLQNFIADGHKPEDVTDVLITSMGNDQIYGLLIGRHTATKNEGRGYIISMPSAAFPNAKLYVSKTEKELVDKIPLPRNPISPPHLTHQVTRAYEDRIVTFDFDTEVLPGITAIEAPKQNPNQVGSTTIFITHDIIFNGNRMQPKTDDK